MARPPATPEAEPLGDGEFARRLDPLGPFEARPRFAIAVSGGPDSLALCLLARRWAEARGGSVLALTVDHGLRPEAADEAVWVGGWMNLRGVPHQTLRWTGAKPAAAFQARARDARYRLLTAACRAAGVLHLLLAHHADDQAETLALRQARGSGEDGLAGMPAVREVADVRLVRPLLDVPKARLLATLRSFAQPWLDDPSNASPAFARSHLRASGLDRDRLVERALAAGGRRRDLDVLAAAWLVKHARIDPAGFVDVQADAWCALPEPVGRRTLLQALACIGGRPYPPREVRLQRLLAGLRSGAVRRTLAGCRVLRGTPGILICREPAAIGPPVELLPGRAIRWDARFELALAADAEGALHCQALGVDAGLLRDTLRMSPPPRSLPVAVLPGLPSLWRGDRLIAVPHLGLGQPGLAGRHAHVRFRPRHPLAGPPFAIAGGA